ncbi:hypothetical protein P7C71_g5714, partial [Lecanoromycetidae sp. Uapishka_2]
MQLIDLPAELLSSLPNYLDTLNDWYALVSTSKKFYTTCAGSFATFPPIFSGDSDDYKSSAYSYFVIAGSARQLADWAVSSEQNRLELGRILALGGHKELLTVS